MAIPSDPFTIGYPIRYEHFIDPPENLSGLRVIHRDNYFLVMKEDTGIKKYAKLARGAVYFPSAVIIYSIILVPIAHLALAVLKFVQFFIPKNFSKTINVALGFTLQLSHKFTEELVYRINCIFSLFLSYERRSALFKYSDEAIYNIYSSKIVANGLKLHIDGFEQGGLVPNAFVEASNV